MSSRLVVTATKI